MCFDRERFVDKTLASEFICSICFNVLCCPQKDKKEPQSKQELTKDADGHIYCEVCITNALNYNKKCPECRRELSVHNLLPLNRILLKLLKSLKLHCKYKNKGCTHIDEYELIECHELKCEFGFSKCNTCGTLVPPTSIHKDIDCLETKFNKIVQTKEREIEALETKINEINKINKSLKDTVTERNIVIADLRNQIEELKLKQNEHNNFDISGLIGRWDLESSENFDEYMKAMGVGFATRKISSSVKPTVLISRNGNTWTFRLESTFKTSEITFILGQEFNEDSLTGKRCKSTITAYGPNKVAQLQRYSSNNVSIITLEIIDDKLFQCLETKGKKAVRVYKRS